MMVVSCSWTSGGASWVYGQAYNFSLHCTGKRRCDGDFTLLLQQQEAKTESLEATNQRLEMKIESLERNSGSLPQDYTIPPAVFLCLLTPCWVFWSGVIGVELPGRHFLDHCTMSLQQLYY